MVNSAATCNRMMRKLLKGVDHADSFVDNLIAPTQGWTTHLGYLRETSEHISKAGLTVKQSKCQFGFRNLKSPSPQTKQQAKSFLSLVGFFWKYIPSFVSVTVPLTDITTKGLPNQTSWGESQEHAFNALKHSLTNSPIPHMPDLDKTFYAQTDASDTGIGATFIKQFNGEMFPVAYASKKSMLPRERACSPIEDYLAIVLGN